MINKKTLAVTAIALLLSQQSFAYENTGLYLGGSYHGQFFNSTGTLEASVNGVHVNDRNAVKTIAKTLSEYKADYNPPFAASLAFGYSGEFKGHNYKAELEGTYSTVKVDNIDLANSQITISYNKGTEKVLRVVRIIME